MSNKVPEFGWEARFWLRGQIGLIGQIGWEGQIDQIGWVGHINLYWLGRPY